MTTTGFGYGFISNKERIKVFVINGKGGVGKDTLIEKFIKQEESSKFGKINGVENISSITPIKNFLEECGLYSEKYKTENRARLAELKRLLSDEVMNYTVSETLNRYYNRLCYCVFVHIREPENIAKFKSIMNDHGVEVATILCKREAVDNLTIGNPADDEVYNYDYDITLNLSAGNWTYGTDSVLDSLTYFIENAKEIIEEKLNNKDKYLGGEKDEISISR